MTLFFLIFIYFVNWCWFFGRDYFVKFRFLTICIKWYFICQDITSPFLVLEVGAFVPSSRTLWQDSLSIMIITFFVQAGNNLSFIHSSKNYAFISVWQSLSPVFILLKTISGLFHIPHVTQQTFVPFLMVILSFQMGQMMSTDGRLHDLCQPKFHQIYWDKSLLSLFLIVRK